MGLFGTSWGRPSPPAMTQPTRQMLYVGLGLRVASAVEAFDPGCPSWPLKLAEMPNYLRDSANSDRFVAALTDGGKLDALTMLQAFTETHVAPNRFAALDYLRNDLRTALGTDGGRDYFRVLADALEPAAKWRASNGDLGSRIMVSYAPASMFAAEGAPSPEPTTMVDVAERINRMSARGLATLYRLADPLMMVTSPKEFAELVQLVDMVDGIMNNRTFAGKNRVISARGKRFRDRLKSLDPESKIKEDVLFLTLSQNPFEGLASIIRAWSPDSRVHRRSTVNEAGVYINGKDVVNATVETARSAYGNIYFRSRKELITSEDLAAVLAHQASPHPLIREAAGEAIVAIYRTFCGSGTQYPSSADPSPAEHIGFLWRTIPLLPPEEQGGAYRDLALLEDKQGHRPEAAAAAHEAAQAFKKNGDEDDAFEMRVRGYALSAEIMALERMIVSEDALHPMTRRDHIRNARIHAALAKFYLHLPSDQPQLKRIALLKSCGNDFTAAAELPALPGEPSADELRLSAAEAYFEAMMTLIERDQLSEATHLKNLRDRSAQAYFQALRKKTLKQAITEGVSVAEAAKRYKAAVAQAFWYALQKPMSPIPEEIAFAALGEAQRSLTSAREQTRAEQETRFHWFDEEVAPHGEESGQ